MKIRNGFVSNSSSSSFILYFKETPKTEDELKHMMFVESEINDDVVGSDEYYGLVFPINTITKTVFNDIKDKEKITCDNFLEKFKDDLYPSEYNLYEIKTLFEKLDITYDFDNIELEINKISCEKQDAYHDLYKYKHTYSDDVFYIKYNEMNDNYDKKIEKIANNIFDVLLPIFKEKYKNSVFYEVEYSDNDGDYFSFIEHGGVLDRITLIKINRH